MDGYVLGSRPYMFEPTLTPEMKAERLKKKQEQELAKIFSKRRRHAIRAGHDPYQVCSLCPPSGNIPNCLAAMGNGNWKYQTAAEETNGSSLDNVTSSDSEMDFSDETESEGHESDEQDNYFGTSSSEDCSDEEVEEISPAIEAFISQANVERSKMKNLLPLQQLCCRKICSIEASIARQKNLIILARQKKPDTLDQLLKYCLENPRDANAEGHHLAKFINLLLTEATEKFSDDILPRKYTETAWQLLVKNCYQLRSLSWTNKLPDFYLAQMSVLSSLEHLHLPYEKFDTQMLKQLADYLPKLKSLELKLEDVTDVGLEHMLRLKSLQRLQFDLAHDFQDIEAKILDLDAKIVALCLLKLPNLEALENIVTMTINHSPGLCKLQAIRPNTFLKLKELWLENQLYISAEQLPDVECLHLSGPLSCFDELLKLKNIESIYVKHCSTEDLFKLLERFGPQITKLSYELEYGRDVHIPQDQKIFNFYKLFNFCPNLKELELYLDECTKEPFYRITSENFRNLVKVDIQMFDSQGHQVPLPIMKHILRCPNLEELRVYWARCFPKALNEVLREKNGCHFQKLEILSAERAWVNDLDTYIESLVELVCRANKLKSINIEACRRDRKMFARSNLTSVCSKVNGLTLTNDFVNI